MKYDFGTASLCYSSFMSCPVLFTLYTIFCSSALLVFVFLQDSNFCINFPANCVNWHLLVCVSVSGNPSLRHGKPGSGVGLGYGLRLKSHLGHLQVDLAINSFKQKTVYFGFSNVSWWTLEPHIFGKELRFGAEEEYSSSRFWIFFPFISWYD